MKSTIEMTGYGYSKVLCADVCEWFISKYLPRHILYINVHHRSMKSENCYGTCDIMNGTHRPRDFIIELQSNMNRSDYIRTLIHELIHLRQWVRDQLKLKYGKLYYKNQNCSDLDYYSQPHENEAYSLEKDYVYDFMKDTGRLHVFRS